MVKKFINCMLALAVVVAAQGLLSAQDGPGESAGDWLNVAVGARAIGMGESYAAIGEDATAIFWNPAGLTKTGKSEFMLQYGIWLAGTSYHAASLVLPLSGSKKPAVSQYRWGNGNTALAQTSVVSQYDRYSPRYFSYSPSFKTQKNKSGSAIGIGITMFNSGPMTGTDQFGEYTENFGLSYNSLLVSYSQALGDSVGMGVTLKAINQDTQSTAGADVGMLISAADKLSLGVVAQNIGAVLDSSALPQNVKAGVGLSLGMITLSADMNTASNSGVGIEFNLGGLAVRGGYKLDMGDMGEGGLLSPGMSVGFGINTESLSLDIAVAGYGAAGFDAGPLDAPTRVSLIFGF